jgi:hypothetical protein
MPQVLTPLGSGKEIENRNESRTKLDMPFVASGAHFALQHLLGNGPQPKGLEWVTDKMKVSTRIKASSN